MIDWVKVSERLPEVGIELLIILNNSNSVMEAVLKNIEYEVKKGHHFKSLFSIYPIENVSHWIEKEKLLPKPELKPCPFCGGKEIKINKVFLNFQEISYHCQCTLCGTRGKVWTSNDDDDDGKEASSYWNMRCNNEN